MTVRKLTPGAYVVACFLLAWGLGAAALAGTSTVSLAQQSAGAGASGPALEQERIEADVSTRSVGITSSFTGQRIVVFGAVENSRQEAPDQRIYDVAVVISGPARPLTIRRKSKVAGIWLNTSAVTFRDIPSFYATLSTAPVDQIAPRPVLHQYGIGRNNLRFAATETVRAKDLREFRSAAIRLRTNQSLFSEIDDGVTFTGRSLFRATIDLPANVTVGEFSTLIFLFRDGELLSTYKTQLNIQRVGFEKFVHTLAFQQPLLYGIIAVILAVLAGLSASAIFRR